MEKKLKRKWLIYAVSGLLCMGFGLSLLGEAILMKAAGDTFWGWFAMGTVALSIKFAGLSLFGQAIVFKSQIDQLKKQD